MLNNTTSHKETSIKNDIIEKNEIKNGDISSNDEKNNNLENVKKKPKFIIDIQKILEERENYIQDKIRQFNEPNITEEEKRLRILSNINKYEKILLI